MRFSLAILCMLAVLFSALVPDSLAQSSGKCAVCGKTIGPGMKFLKSSDGRIFCSQACYEKTLPKCCICKKTLSGGYLKGADGRLYCSEKCISTTWPTCSACGAKSQKGAIISAEKGDLFFCEKCHSKPKCFCCGLPADCSKLDDGRHICPNCSKDAIGTLDEAVKLIGEVRALMGDKLKLKTEHQIEYELVDQKKLEEISPQNQHGVELGLFRYIEETETTTVTSGLKTTETVNVTRNYKIYMLSHMSRRKFIEVAAHELGHDWMQEYYPKIDELNVKEGWAQYVAWRINDIHGQKGLNRMLEANKDPVYGDGFRMVRKASEKSSSPMEALHSYFRDRNN